MLPGTESEGEVNSMLIATISIGVLDISGLMMEFIPETKGVVKVFVWLSCLMVVLAIGVCIDELPREPASNRQHPPENRH